MVLVDLADLLSSGGVGTPGSTADWGIFEGRLQDTPGRQIALNEYGGLPPVRGMASAPGLALAEQPRVQVVVRGNAFDYTAARAKVHAVWQLLDGHPTRTINGVRYLGILTLQSPFLLEWDDNERPVFAFNVQVVKELDP